VFVAGKVADSTTVIAVVAIIAVVVVVVVVMFYCYKVKNRYRTFRKDFDTVSQITNSMLRNSFI